MRLWIVAVAIGAVAGARAAELWIGAATADITPPVPAPLTGGKSVRIARQVGTPLTATALAIEAREGGRPAGQAILVSCDLCVIRKGIQEGFRKHLEGRLPGFDTRNLFLAATHTHSAPVIQQDRYEAYGDAIQPKDYVPLLYDRMAEAVAAAWSNRAPGAVAWGLGRAVAGENRRAVFADGRAVMYGNAAAPDFRGAEGGADSAVDVLCFYDRKRKLKAAAIALAAPAQAGGSGINADYWHPVRERIRAKHGTNVCVLGFCAPAGDLVPKPLVRAKAEARMEKMRGLSHAEEIGRRVADAFDDVAGVIAADLRTDVPFAHAVRDVALPARRVTDDEAEAARKVVAAIDAKAKLAPTDWWVRNFNRLVVARHERQKAGDGTHAIEMHVLRIGDVAIATNPFELFLNYGEQIVGRSPAGQTMLIQLAAATDEHYYVPTSRALAGGGYSAEPTHNLVGPEGAQALVERTVEAIGELWRPVGETRP
ncbi:MAG: hypothetical protein FJ221_18895 [Lentisphaerae bacterium]|nr:hypothetical protein [Lentisphaerota bacterium]